MAALPRLARKTENASGCTSTCSRTLTIQEGGPLLCLISGPSTACLGATGLVFTATGYATYNWTVTGGTITAGAGTGSITVTSNAEGTASKVLTIKGTILPDETPKDTPKG